MLKSIRNLFVALISVLPTNLLLAADSSDALTKLGFGKRMNIDKVAYGTTSKSNAMSIVVVGENTQRFPGWHHQFTPGRNGIVYTDSLKDDPYALLFRDLTDQTTVKINIGKLRARSPALSPDGTRLAFEVWLGNPVERHDIYVRRSEPYSFEDAAECQPLTNAYSNSFPRWSPDGTKILFQSNRPGKGQVFVMDQDGGNQTRLTDVSVNAFRPVWSPDGDFIMYAELYPTAKEHNYRSEIYIIRNDGSEKRRIGKPGADYHDPVWSPDGEWIAFTRENPRTKVGNIWMIRNDGTDEHQVTRNSIYTHSVELSK